MSFLLACFIIRVFELVEFYHSYFLFSFQSFILLAINIAIDTIAYNNLKLITSVDYLFYNALRIPVLLNESCSSFRSILLLPILPHPLPSSRLSDLPYLPSLSFLPSLDSLDSLCILSPTLFSPSRASTLPPALILPPALPAILIPELNREVSIDSLTRLVWMWFGRSFRQMLR
jgi:hypothetical protein